jgi:hypothetical protein
MSSRVEAVHLGTAGDLPAPAAGNTSFTGGSRRTGP